MNVYDFDDTIYKGDSTLDFFLFCLKKEPKVIFCMPCQVYGVLGHLFHRLDTKEMKECFFSFLPRLNHPEKLVEAFWDSHQHKIKTWYRENKTTEDLVISASPFFLIAPICARLGIAEPIASPTSIHTGKFEGENCKGKEKVTQFYKRFPNGRIERFYSDSKSDTPLAKIAQQAYLVKGSEITAWEFT